MKGIFFANQSIELINRVYSSETQNNLKAEIELLPNLVTYDTLSEKKEILKDVELIFSTWGMPSCSIEEIKTFFPSLKAIFYAAGSVQSFAKPFLDCGVRVFSAWGANAVPVAEYTVAQIILANKGFYQASRMAKLKNYNEAGEYSQAFPGSYGAKIGIIGCGMIGSLVVKMLKSYRLEILVFDPFLSEELAIELKIRKCSLEEIFSNCHVMSNHLANNEQTKNILNYRLFSKMKPNATFINTGRGAQVMESDLIRALKEYPMRTAVLDVTMPEPPTEGSELYILDNVVLTPHIAGSMGNELFRMGEYMYEEFKSFITKAPLKYEVTSKMLKTMA